VPVAVSAPEETLALMAFHVIGRLAGGAAPTHARDELARFYGRADASPWQRELRAVVHTLPRLVLGETRPALIAFVAASALLLLITCINVANLLVVRGVARAREIAVRSALGAGRRQVIAQLLTESTLLAALGGVIGLGVAAAAVRTFTAFAPAGVPRLDEIHLNATALAGAVAITGIALLLFALAPAVMTARVEIRHMLGSGTRHGTGRRSRRASEALVAGQVALALLVLSAAGLIARSLIALERADLAFEPSNLLIAELALPREQFDDAERQHALLERLVPALRAIPGVSAVSPIVAVPFSGSHGWDGRPSADGQSPEEAAANPMLNMEVVTPDYFAALGVPVLHGRAFTDSDGAGGPAVIMVSQSVARYFWPGSDPIGRQLRLGPTGPGLAVVGVVPDTRYRELRDARPSIYFPLRQSFFPFAPTTLALRSSAPPSVTVSALRHTIAESAPGVAVASAAPFDTYLAGALAHPRLNALLLAVFAGAAVVLAAVGLFAVMMTMVRQRRREFGVRLALGATGRDLRRMVLRHALAIAAAGALAGLAGAVIANRLLVALLYDVSPTDLPTLAWVTGSLLAVAALASLAPAWSSARVDPAAVLRT
jgi:putative ABC transport system permease protein